ncbi:MAG: glycoside hydrolase family 65 protein [Bacillota bacterium]
MGNYNSKKPQFPLNEWEITEERFDIGNNYQNETIFALGNGYLGMRGNFEEGLPGPPGMGHEGTYINGFYESETIKYPETAYGFAEKSQTMLNVTNGKIIKMMVEDEEFNMLAGEIGEYRRTLSLKEGILYRSLLWSSPKGRKVRLDIQRMVSLSNKHLAVIRYEAVSVNFSGKIRLISILDGNVTNIATENDPRVGSGLQGRVLMIKEKMAEDDAGLIVQQTKNTGFTLACAMCNRIETGGKFKRQSRTGEYSVEVEYEFTAEPGTKIRLDKYISYVTSLDYPETEVAARAKQEILKAQEAGLDAIKLAQFDFLNEFWYKTDLVIKGDPVIQQGMRFNIFHLLQATGRDGRTNIAAKGLTGEGYEGHYFWDTETYILPFFLYNNPGIARKLLEYRYSILDKARQRARQMSHPKGALFPWRTINGEECSAYFPAGTAQYHIDADIAFAIKRYMEATADQEFLIKYGAEILFETARLWADLGVFMPGKGNKFCINMVTGPDEYTALVNNNCYTNLLAQVNLSYAYETARWMQENAKEDYRRLAAAIGLEEDELEFWKKAGDNMFIPYDQRLQLYLQDENFLDRAPWDFANTPPENYPLLIHYHPLVIYRHQVCKQADLVLALFLLGQKFSLDEKRRNYDFYEKVTTHDSSLSTCIFSIVASEIGYTEKAYQYFLSTVRMDLDNYHGNTKDGIHAANMAGAWMCLVNGFAGMRVYDGVLSFNPYLPHGWEEYRFKIVFQGRLLEITVNQSGTTFTLLEGEPLEITFKGVKQVLK